MLPGSKIKAIAEWHLPMSNILEFICWHVHVAGWIRKCPKWAIGSTSAASPGAWHVRRSPDNVQIRWYREHFQKKMVWNSVSEKYGTGLHLFRPRLCDLHHVISHVALVNQQCGYFLHFVLVLADKYVSIFFYNQIYQYNLIRLPVYCPTGSSADSAHELRAIIWITMWTLNFPDNVTTSTYIVISIIINLYCLFLLPCLWHIEEILDDVFL